MCPHCGGKNKKPFYKKWWFWLIIILIIAGAASSGGSKTDFSGKKNDTKLTAAEEVSAAETEPDVPTEYLTALLSAESYNKLMHMSKQGIYDQLASEYGEKFTKEEASYAIEHLDD